MKDKYDQPPPLEGKGDIWGVVVLDMNYFARTLSDEDFVTSLKVIDDMRSRRAVGIARYGTVLQIHNGRNALADAYQEMLDFVAYLTQAHREGILGGAHYKRMREQAFDALLILREAM